MSLTRGTVYNVLLSNLPLQISPLFYHIPFFYYLQTNKENPCPDFLFGIIYTYDFVSVPHIISIFFLNTIYPLTLKHICIINTLSAYAIIELNTDPSD